MVTVFAIQNLHPKCDIFAVELEDGDEEMEGNETDILVRYV